MTVTQGGYVTFVAVAAYNLPALGTLLGGHTNPYFRVRIGNVIQTSSVVRASTNPVWSYPGEDVPFGIFDSATPVTVELWNRNGGFFGPDDLLGTMTTVVPACNMFVSDQCEEGTRMPLAGTGSCYLNDDVTQPDPSARCAQFGFRIKPFELRITGEAPLLNSNDQVQIQVGIANNWPAQSVDPTSGIWMGDPTTKIFSGYLPFKPAAGGYVVKLKQNERTYNIANYVNFTVNYDCTVFVFRDAQVLQDVPTLPWLADFTQPVGLALHTLQSDTLNFVGYQKFYPAGSTVVIPGAKYQMGAFTPANQNIVVVRFVADQTPPPVDPLKKFDRTAFMSLFWQFIFPLIPLFWWSGRIILKLKFRCVAWGRLCVRE